MPDSHNKLSQFWQELKRRKVFRVVAMYAATAFILLELVDIITPALLLPAWTVTLVIVLLAIGFPIAAILSWVFDITPEGVKKTEAIEDSEEQELASFTAGKGRFKISDLIIVVLIVVVGILAYPKIFKKDTFEAIKDSDGKVSVAIMPFRNMTNDTIWDVWQDGIKDNIITYLSNYSEDLTIRQPEFIDGLLKSKGLTNYSSITPSVERTISQKLDTKVYISGSISQAGNTIRVNAQLINSKTEETFKSFQLDGSSEQEIFQMIDSISVLVKNFLMISVMEKEIPKDFRKLISTTSPEAFRYYKYGSNAFYKLDLPMAREWLLQSITIDSNFTEAIRMLSYTCGHLGLDEEAKKWCLRHYGKKDLMSTQEKIWADILYAIQFETPYEQINYFKLLIANDDQMPVPYHNLGGAYWALHQYAKATSEFEKELQIYENWGIRPRWVNSYISLGEAYHIAGQYRKEEKLYKKAELDFPDEPGLLRRQAILSLSEAKTDDATEYIDKYISIRKENSVSEAGIMEAMADIYYVAENLDIAEEYYRKALTLEPGSPESMGYLAWLLIDNDRNIVEGMELINKALEINPTDYLNLDARGWGLYKQGKLEESLATLKEAWEQKPIYDHDIFIHIQEVEKAITRQ